MMNGTGNSNSNSGGERVDAYDRGRFDKIWEQQRDIADLRRDIGVHEVMIDKMAETQSALGQNIEALTGVVSGLVTVQTKEQATRQVLTWVLRAAGGLIVFIAGWVSANMDWLAGILRATP